MKDDVVTVTRDGMLFNTFEGNLKQGDVVVLQAGDVVPADLELVEARGLEIDEFDITGEILPVRKDTNGKVASIYRGSKVVGGTGKGRVFATGDQTELGRVVKLTPEPISAYGFRIFKIKYLGLLVLLLPAFVIDLSRSENALILIGRYLALSGMLILAQNDDLFKYLLVSKGHGPVSRSNIEIRDWSVLEGMNAVDVICFDKTGVLTTRQLEVKTIALADQVLAADNAFRSLEGGTAHLIKLACALCHDVSFFEKLALANPIDKALIKFAEDNGIDVRETLLRSKRIYEQPFNSENRYMANGFEVGNKEYVFAKGDPEVILKLCTGFVAMTGAEKKMSFEFRIATNSQVDAINQKGDTAIALAYACDNTPKTHRDYTFLCLLELENSLQPGVREIIGRLRGLGKRSILLTGDRPAAAARVAADCRITENSRVFLDGKIINRMELNEVARQSSYCSVFARLTPSQKGVLIRLLQQRGHTVAMIGDGPNDGIALKAADIGISFVKNSSPIARQLSKILIDELGDLLTLIEGAEWIRTRTTQFRLFSALLIVVTFLFMYMRI